MFKAFQYRLFPSASQKARLEAVKETCRHFWNDCLRERKDAYDLHGISITKTEQLRKVKVEKDTSPYALDIHSHILQGVVADLDKAFQAFLRSSAGSRRERILATRDSKDATDFTDSASKSTATASRSTAAA